MNRNKGRIGFTAGNFDLIHPGYIYAFNDAKKNCDYLIVFLHDNPSIERSEKYKPAIPIHERYQTLMALKSVDEVVTYQTEEDLLKLIEFFNPKVFMMENVPGILTMSNGKVKDTMMKEFERLGYKNTSVRILESANFEVPQMRTRAIFIGNRLNQKNPYPKIINSKDDYLKIENFINDLKNQFVFSFI